MWSRNVQERDESARGLTKIHAVSEAFAPGWPDECERVMAVANV